MVYEKNTILMVGPLPPQIGGIEFFVESLLNSQLSHRCSLRHFDISKPKSRNHVNFRSPMGYARSFKRNIFISFLSFGYSIFYYVKFIFVITSPSIVLVHLHTSSYMSFWEKCAYIDVAKLFNKKLVLHIHGSSFDLFLRKSHAFMQRLILWHLHRCDCVVALSQAWKEFFSEFLPAQKIALIENGVDLSAFENIQKDKSAEPSIIFLGEVCHRKGVYDLLQVIAQVLLKLPQMNCYLVGPGEIGKARAFAESLGISQSVHLLGPRYGIEKIRIMSQSWCLVLPSYAEVFPIVLLEAFACGLPVISTTVGGIPDLVRQNENGILVQPGDHAAMEQAIYRLLNDTALQEQMSQANLQAAKEKYDINICAEKILAVYDYLLNSD